MNSAKLERLRSAIEEIDRIEDSAWLASLNARKKRELEFHDRNRDRWAKAKLDQDTYDRFYANKKYYVATDSSRQYLYDWIALHAKGKVFLDYACGDGAVAIRAAKADAALVIGIDISRVSVENARRDAASAGVSDNTFFVQSDAENTLLPADCADVILCSGMLHHLDLSYAFPELRRILAPGGMILAMEALSYNPLIKAYRWLTPELRTDWEKAHILSLEDVEFAKRFFVVDNVRYWHILTIAAPHVKPLTGLLRAADRLLTRVPLVRLMAWMFTFEMHKPSLL